MTLTKQHRKNLILYGSLLGCFASGFAAGAFDLPHSSPIFAAWFAVTLVLASVAAFYCWSLLDEAQKEAHKWAWYWGGSLGMFAGFIALIVGLRLDPNLLEGLRPDATAKTYVEWGFAWAVLSMLLGYSVAWVVWWLKRR